jgi:crotonobetainyl-CoA:carnitine CoA-transferase CaiB-like acyl-CoA transferase
VRTAEDVVDNDIFVAATAADGSQYEVPRPPYQSSHAHWTTATGVVPKVGEHTNEILAELGFPADQIERIAGDIEVAAK